MIIRFHYSADDLSRMLQSNSAPKGSFESARFSMIVVALFIIFRLSGRLQGWELWIFAGSVGMIVITYFLPPGIQPPKGWIDGSRDSKQPEVQIELQADGYSFTKAKLNKFTKWNECRRISRSQNGFMFWGNSPMYIPSRVLDQVGGESKFLDILEGFVGKEKIEQDT